MVVELKLKLMLLPLWKAVNPATLGCTLLSPVKAIPGKFTAITPVRLATLSKFCVVIGREMVFEVFGQILSEPIDRITGGAAEVTVSIAILEVVGLEQTPLTLTLKR